MKETVYGFTPIDQVFKDIDFNPEPQPFSDKQEFFMSFIREGFSMGRNLTSEEKGNNFLSVFDKWKERKFRDLIYTPNSADDATLQALEDFSHQDIHDLSNNIIHNAKRKFIEFELTGKEYNENLNNINFFTKLAEASKIGLEIVSRRRVNKEIATRYKQDDVDFLTEINEKLSDQKFGKNVKTRKFTRQFKKFW